MIFSEDNPEHLRRLSSVLTDVPASALALRARLLNSYALTAVQPAEVWRAAMQLVDSGACQCDVGRSLFRKNDL